MYTVHTYKCMVLANPTYMPYSSFTEGKRRATQAGKKHSKSLFVVLSLQK